MNRNAKGNQFRENKRDANKGVQFTPGEHAEIIVAVEIFYRDAKVTHNIAGPVLIILAEDEMKVKRKVAWEPKIDTLVGFCGPSDYHVCVSGFRPIVGCGEDKYCPNGRIFLIKPTNIRHFRMWSSGDPFA